MYAQNALIGSARLLSSSLTVQFRGRRLSLSLAFMLCAVVSLCLFDPAEANAHPRTSLRRNVGSQLGGNTDLFNVRKVKCAYFTAWPVRTYCHIVSWGGIIAHDALLHGLCHSIGMSIVRMTTTPMYRLCYLMKLFHIEDHVLWVKDTLLQPYTLTWDDCYFDVLNETKPPANCTSCYTSMICDDARHFSNGPNCVGTPEGDMDVEYCYVNDKVNATEASKRCTEQSSALVEWEKVGESRVLREAILRNLEFWVDLKKEDVRELSGVVAFNLDDIDWNVQCVTVWFGREVPWFYKRNCSQLYPVICENITFAQNRKDAYIRIRGYCANHSSYSRPIVYCLSEGTTFNKTTGSEFCANFTFSLLNAKALHRHLTLSYHSDKLHKSQSDSQSVIWDARSTSSRQHGSNTCLAVNIDPFSAQQRIPYNCSEELGYICRKSNPPKTHGFTCENASLAYRGRRPVCRLILKKPYHEAARECDVLGMGLLPGAVDNKYITNIIKYYEDYTHRGRARHYWLDVPQLSISSHECTAARYDGSAAVAVSGISCNSPLLSLCAFTNIERRPAVAPSTSEIATDIATDTSDIANGTASDTATDTTYIANATVSETNIFL